MNDAFYYIRYQLRHSLPKGNARRLLLSVLVLLALPASVILVRQVQRYRTDAAFDTVDVYFSPSQQSLPPDSNFKIMMDAKTNKLGFARVEFSFDPASVNMTSEITTTDKLATVVQKTSMSEANSKGVAVIVLALSTTDISTPPTGIFELANFSMRAVSPQPNSMTTVSMNTSGIQLIDMQSQVLPFMLQQASLVLNHSSPDTGTSSITETATPNVTGTLTSTVVPTSFLTSTSTGAPASPETNAPKRGDVNRDGIVNSTDIGIIVDVYGTSPAADPRADLNNDGSVNIIDIGVVIDNYSL